MSLWSSVEMLKKLNWVDLTHPLDENSPYWGGMPEGVVELCKTVFDYDNPILKCRIHTYKFPGQFGTHVDFPLHFEPGLAASDAFQGPQGYKLVVLDITEQMKSNIEYPVGVEDILVWEAKNGPIPAGSFVALRTDWHKRWPSNDAMNNFDAEGGEHCPGWSMEAIKFLYEERQVAMTGHETFDTDASSVACAYEDLACERYILGNGHLQLEAMCNLDKVPATGALIFIAWPHIQGATGLPVRAWAVFD